MKKKASFWEKKRTRRAVRDAKKKRAAGICLTPHCRKPPRPQRCYCNTCRSRMYDDPLKVLFWNLRKSAKRRHKAFSLTFEYFEKLAVSSGYDVSHGRGGQDLTIDRIENHLGYIPGNVRAITRAENCRKYTGPATEGAPF